MRTARKGKKNAGIRHLVREFGQKVSFHYKQESRS